MEPTAAPSAEAVLWVCVRQDGGLEARCAISRAIGFGSKLTEAIEDLYLRVGREQIAMYRAPVHGVDPTGGECWEAISHYVHVCGGKTRIGDLDADNFDGRLEAVRVIDERLAALFAAKTFTVAVLKHLEGLLSIPSELAVAREEYLHATGRP